MQRAVGLLVEAGGAVLYHDLRAALFERLAGRPLPLTDQDAHAFGSSLPSQAAGLGAGAECPAPEASAACPAVCLGLVVDLSGGVSPLLLATVLSLLG
eukprot:8084031-Pyramimonas_sp.AAC.1